MCGLNYPAESIEMLSSSPIDQISNNAQEVQRKKKVFFSSLISIEILEKSIAINSARTRLAIAKQTISTRHSHRECLTEYYYSLEFERKEKKTNHK